MRFIKKIVERGNVTIPSDVREALGVEEGDIIEFEVIRVVKKGAPDEAGPQTTSHSFSPPAAAPRGNGNPEVPQ